MQSTTAGEAPPIAVCMDGVGIWAMGEGPEALATYHKLHDLYLASKSKATVATPRPRARREVANT
jgi:hypothetical protein